MKQKKMPEQLDIMRAISKGKPVNPILSLVAFLLLVAAGRRTNDA